MPVPGVTLAKDLDVSRQIIVSDIALLRANGLTILSTNKGVITDKEARKLQVGGEVLAFVW